MIYLINWSQKAFIFINYSSQWFTLLKKLITFFHFSAFHQISFEHFFTRLLNFKWVFQLRPDLFYETQFWGSCTLMGSFIKDVTLYPFCQHCANVLVSHNHNTPPPPLGVIHKWCHPSRGRGCIQLCDMQYKVVSKTAILMWQRGKGESIHILRYWDTRFASP